MQRAYLIGTLSLVAATALCVIALCFFVDPYNMYPRHNGANEDQHADLFYHLRLHKPYAMQRLQPEHLIIGSSRSARLPPHYLGQPSYNASLPGITLLEMRRMVEHAQAIRPLKSLYLGVDYYMFRKGHSALTEHFEEQRLLRVNPSLADRFGHRFQRLEDGFRSLFSVDAILDSVATLQRRETSQRRYREDGTWFSDGSAKQPRWLFSALNRQKFKDFTTETDALDATEFTRLLQFCRENNIATTVLISPFHGSVMNTVHLAGQWKSYLNWQRMVSKTVIRSAGEQRTVGLEHNPTIVLEPLNSSSPFFYDGVHYTDEAGRQIMACLVDKGCAAALNPEILTGDTTAPYLKRVDGLMRSYRRKNPTDYAALLRWLDRSDKT
jgi:hypothetical protein